MTKHKPRAIIFLDIDGTLIDSYDGPNISNPKRYFEKFQKDGIVFGINSNRSLEDILPIAKRFSINGPIIGENGAFKYSIANSLSEIYISQKDRIQMAKIKKILPSLVQEYFVSRKLNSKWVTTDTVKFLLKTKNPKHFVENQIIILNNKFRKYTTSAHIKIVSNGTLKSATMHIKPLSKYIAHRLSKYPVTVIGHPHYCNLLVYCSKFSKRTGMKKLKRSYPEVPFCAIGDEVHDYEMVKDIGDFFTIKNSSSDVQKLAKRVSNLPLTKGVIDIVQKEFYNAKKS